MQTRIPDSLLNTPQGQEADAILRRCVHCGFCTATCPTYQLLGDELDGPRGRIYLVKQLLEGREVTRKTQVHLDRCLTCRACETTCPSGVVYHRLADIGRERLEQAVSRPWRERLMRFALRNILPYRNRFSPLVKLGRLVSPLLPSSLKSKIPPRQTSLPWPAQAHQRSMLILDACVQADGAPNTNASAARVLDRLGVQLIDAAQAGCCGAVSYHLAQVEEGKGFMRANIDAWWPYIESGAEAIVITASGCGAMVKEYGAVLQHDPDYADRAKRVSELCKDISEVLQTEDLSALRPQSRGTRVAFHSPCTLQHGQQIRGGVEGILQKSGYELSPVPDAHLCCGSAGTYSILQNRLARQLLENKLAALQSGEPEVIATANIGCHLHLQSGTSLPVKHWIELLEEALPGK
ncbi:MAG: glycolate oxidase subunit GlcF [Gammaproteobacteria bacterium]|nr:glycolate oxidase subunit GlcF [Gammaproteobacteria bacterium]